MRIEHIALYVNDLEAARDFFVKYFDGKSNDGYHNPNTGLKTYFISFDEGTRLEIMNRPKMKDDTKSIYRTGYSHIAFSVKSNEELESLTERIKNDGYEILNGPRITGDGYYESCIVGIEDNQIEITVESVDKL